MPESCEACRRYGEFKIRMTSCIHKHTFGKDKHIGFVVGEIEYTKKGLQEEERVCVCVCARSDAYGIETINEKYLEIR